MLHISTLQSNYWSFWSLEDITFNATGDITELKMEKKKGKQKNIMCHYILVIVLSDFAVATRIFSCNCCVTDWGVLRKLLRLMCLHQIKATWDMFNLKIHLPHQPKSQISAAAARSTPSQRQVRPNYVTNPNLILTCGMVSGQKSQPKRSNESKRSKKNNQKLVAC